MKRKTLIVVGAAVILGLVALMPVFAQGPGPPANPIYATVEYVDQRFEELKSYADQQLAALSDEIAGVYDHFAQEIDRLDARIDQIGGATGPDFDLPAQEDWIVSAYGYSNPYGCVHDFLKVKTQWTPDNVATTCNWHGVELMPGALTGSIQYPTGQASPARAIATYNGDILAHGVGGCPEIFFPRVQYLPSPGETIDLDIWVFWMGAEKHTTISRGVTAAPDTPTDLFGCHPDSEQGPAPHGVRFTIEAIDGLCEVLTYHLDFGDGEWEDGEMEVESVSLLQERTKYYTTVAHTYETPGIYRPALTLTDLAGRTTTCTPGSITVY